MNNACCRHIADYGLLAYQRIPALSLYMKQKLKNKLSFGCYIYTEELIPYKAMNLTSSDYAINSHVTFHNYPSFYLM